MFNNAAEMFDNGAAEMFDDDAAEMIKESQVCVYPNSKNY